MIFGRHLILQTDHKPLLGIFGSKKGIPVHTAANRLQRWALTLLQYDFKIEFQKTESFGYADLLSRLIGQHSKPDDDYLIASLQMGADIRSIQTEAVSVLPITSQLIFQESKKDATLQAVLKQVRDNWPSTRHSNEIGSFYKRRGSNRHSEVIANTCSQTATCWSSWNAKNEISGKKFCVLAKYGCRY